MCQASARGRATNASPEHVFVCIIPAPPAPSAAVVGAVNLGRRACGLPNSRTPAPPAPCATAAPCVCDHHPLVPCTASLSSRHFGNAQLLWRHQIPPVTTTSKTLPCTYRGGGGGGGFRQGKFVRGNLRVSDRCRNYPYEFFRATRARPLLMAGFISRIMVSARCHVVQQAHGSICDTCWQIHTKCPPQNGEPTSGLADLASIVPQKFGCAEISRNRPQGTKILLPSASPPRRESTPSLPQATHTLNR